jgi:hypothetical protein
MATFFQKPKEGARAVVLPALLHNTAGVSSPREAAENVEGPHRELLRVQQHLQPRRVLGLPELPHDALSKQTKKSDYLIRGLLLIYYRIVMDIISIS